MNLNYLIWGLMLFLIGIGVGCSLGNRWVKVTYYWTQMKTFGEREDVAKIRAEAGVDVASTKVISPIGEDYLPD